MSSLAPGRGDDEDDERPPRASCLARLSVDRDWRAPGSSGAPARSPRALPPSASPRLPLLRSRVLLLMRGARCIGGCALLLPLLLVESAWPCTRSAGVPLSTRMRPGPPRAALALSHSAELLIAWTE